jgi:predicted hotdog family 3-hydroxylacyl-ACP dehydratase
MTTLDRAAIERCVPHTGAMVLLDSVTLWDGTRIVCSAPPPGADHPLAREGSVSAVAAVEYGAQAAAVHGFLIEAPSTHRPGLLAKLTDVQLHVSHIPSNLGPLRVNAQLLSRVAEGCLYEFDVQSVEGSIAQGRLMVAFTPLAAAGDITGQVIGANGGPY